MQSLSTMYGPATCHLLNLHERKETESEPPGPNPWRQVHTDIHTDIHTYRHTYGHTYIQTYTHVQTYRYTGRLTYIQTHRCTYIQTYTQTDIPTYRKHVHTYRHPGRKISRLLCNTYSHTCLILGGGGEGRRRGLGTDHGHDTLEFAP